MGIAVGISLLSCVQAEIYGFQIQRPPSGSSGFLLLTGLLTAYSTTMLMLLTANQYNTNGMFVPENMSVAVGIVFITRVELKIYIDLYGTL